MSHCPDGTLTEHGFTEDSLRTEVRAGSTCVKVRACVLAGKQVCGEAQLGLTPTPTPSPTLALALALNLTLTLTLSLKVTLTLTVPYR